MSAEAMIQEMREHVLTLLPARDFTTPGPVRMSFDEAMHKIDVEYRDALALLGRI
ncbi:hypothetical protein JOF53_004827 [Crossiella equi]|uniref:Uncharacterized protein n=1 Tax=Crossiella equi TaxID=130796 RepID=A0ABS5AH98_9PSEU|nr:hypothetical protein [Crossiella equi]MBP2475955.1 hypothetical protein [Crossiella equi]